MDTRTRYIIVIAMTVGFLGGISMMMYLSSGNTLPEFAIYAIIGIMVLFLAVLIYAAIKIRKENL